MKTIEINDGFASDDKAQIMTKVAQILGADAKSDFKIDENGNILEYKPDDDRANEPIVWKIKRVRFNDDNTVLSVDIDA